MISVKKLEKHLDDRGWLMEILRVDDVEFFNSKHPFGQIYCTTVRPGVIKAWHQHEQQTDRICCIKGRVKLVVLQELDSGDVDFNILFEDIIGDENPALVMFPPGLWHGFMNVGDSEAYVVNIPDEPHDRVSPDERRCSLEDISYDWTVKNR